MASKKDSKKNKKYKEHDPEKYIDLKPTSGDMFRESKKLMSFREYMRETRK